MTQEAVNEVLAPIQRGIKPTHQYYRQPNGWITMGVCTLLERARFQQKGWEPLDQYGRFDMAHVWSANNPLVSLFQMGGAKELPVDQVIAMGFHLKCPDVPTCGELITEVHRHDKDCYRGATPPAFPQLDGVTLPTPAQCRFCARDPFPTEAARDQHEGVIHKEEKGQIRTGETLANHMLRGLGPVLGDSAEEAEPNAVALLESLDLSPEQREKLQAAGIPIGGEDSGEEAKTEAAS